MDLGAVIHSYGGPVLFVWAWLQGEAAVIVGGALAAAGYWPWWAVTLIALLPATLGHQIYFALGRPYGAAANAALGRVARSETWILGGAVALGLVVHALSRRAGGRLS